MSERETEQEICRQEVLRELRAIGLARATDCLCIQDNRVELRTDALTRDQAAAIAYMERTGTGWKVKFFDKLKALELLADYLSLFQQTPETQSQRCNLLEAIVDATKEDLHTDDIPELQQTAITGNDLVEPTPVP